MNGKKEILNLTIQNTTAGTLPVSLLGNPANLDDNANATTAYFWDVTSFTLGVENTITIQYAITGSPTYQTATVQFNGTTYQDVVNALNTLGLGGFGVLFSGGNWYIYKYNLIYQFGDLNIYNPAVIPTSFVGNLVDAGDTLAFDINAVNQVTFVGAVPISGTYNASIGDTLTISGTSGAIGYTITLTQYPDNIVLFTQILPPATPYIHNWVAATTKNYIVTATP